MHNRRRPVACKYTTKGNEDKPDASKRTNYRNYDKSIRNSLKGNIILGKACRQSNLHGRQGQGNVHRRRRQPEEIVMEEASILVPGYHVTTQGIVLRQAVYLIQMAETYLSIVEASVDSE